MRASVFAALSILFLSACNRSNDEGVIIHYDIAVILPEDTEVSKHKVQLFYQNGKLRKLQTDYQKPQCQLVFPGWIADFNTQRFTTLVDHQDRKLKEVKTFEQSMGILGMIGDERDIELVPGSKVILGYKCQKAMYLQTEIWYTTSLPFHISPYRPNLLKGAVLETRNGPFIYQATSVSREKIDDAYFNTTQREEIAPAKLASILYDCTKVP